MVFKVTISGNAQRPLRRNSKVKQLLSHDGLFRDETLVPSLPAHRSNPRNRLEETPSHPGGLSDLARARLADRKQAGMLRRALFERELMFLAEGFSAGIGRPSDGPKGLGDFQRRLNRFEYEGLSSTGRDRAMAPRNKSPTATPTHGGSTRVPNVGWDSTPLHGDSRGPKDVPLSRTWDSTPRIPRSSPDGDVPTPKERMLPLDAREWEEEQLRLDRDWYMSSEGGVIAGDEESNPLAMYEYDTMDQRRQEEIAAKKVVGRISPPTF